MFMLRTLTTVGLVLVLVLAAGASAADKRGQSGKNHAKAKIHPRGIGYGGCPKSGELTVVPKSASSVDTAREAHSGLIYKALCENGVGVKAKPQQPKQLRATSAAKSGGTLENVQIPSYRDGSPTSFFKPAGCLKNPDRPLAWTDDNGAPLDGGLSVKSRSSRKGLSHDHNVDILPASNFSNAELLSFDHSVVGQDQETGKMVEVNVKGKPMPKRPN